MKDRKCRFCSSELKYTFCDLGVSPLANAYLNPDDLDQMEPFYPLHAYVCGHCFLVQLENIESPEHIFNDYAYFSSYSETWLRHAKSYANDMCNRFSLGSEHQVIEVASNDGYLLQYFKERNVPVLGIEPAGNVAEVAIKNGIPTRVEFFGRKYAKKLCSEGIAADLLIGNNVLAHVPDLNDFVSALMEVLKPDGVITMEFPHLMRLLQENQFDTIYHEHFSYFSLITVSQVFKAHGLRLFDVEELKTHGGSLRIYACHEKSRRETSGQVELLMARECDKGLNRIETYLAFNNVARDIKWQLLDLLIKIRRSGKKIAAYGAAAKGNTLLNYCGIRIDFIEYVVDRNPHKQNRFLPGSRIPILSPDKIGETRPEYILIFPWNIREEIMESMSYIRDWGGKFIVSIPKPKIVA